MHEAWAQLSMRSPKAGALLHLLAAKVGDQNAVIVSQKTMATWLGCSVDTIKRAVAELKGGNWLEVRQLGQSGSMNAYVLNDRVVWWQSRDGLRYSLFNAAVIISEAEQPDKTDLGNQPPLRKLPNSEPGERQSPSGPGLPPPSEPSIPGLEPDLPATITERSGAEDARPINEIMRGMMTSEPDD